MNGTLASALPVMGIIVSFILTSHLEYSPRPVSGTFMCPDTENSIPELPAEAETPLPAEQEQEQADDDNDYAKESSKLANPSSGGSLSANHFFDHPSFDQTHIRVTTPPPKA